MAEILKMINNMKTITICTDLYYGKVWHSKCNTKYAAFKCCKECEEKAKCTWTCSKCLVDDSFKITADCSLSKKVNI